MQKETKKVKVSSVSMVRLAQKMLRKVTLLKYVHASDTGNPAQKVLI